MNIKLLLVAIALCAVAAPLRAQDNIKFETGSLETVLKLGAAQNKLVFLDAYAAWCGPCKGLEKYVFTDPTVAEYFNKTFVNTRIDMEKGEGPGLAEIFNVEAYPTLLFLDANSKVVAQHVGALNAEELIVFGDNVATNYPLYLEKKAKYEKNVRDKNFLFEYIKTLEALEYDAEAVANDYFKACSDADLLTIESASMIVAYTTSIESREFKVFLSNRSRYEEMIGLKRVHKKFIELFRQSFNGVVEKEPFNETDYKALQAKLTQIAPYEASIAQLYGEIFRYEKVKDFDNLANATLKLSATPRTSDNLLNSVAWYLYEQCDNPQVLQKALEISKLSLQTTENAAYYDTYAALLFKLKDVKKAILFQQMAIEYAESEEDVKRLTDTLNQMKAKGGR